MNKRWSSVEENMVRTWWCQRRKSGSDVRCTQLPLTLPGQVVVLDALVRLVLTDELVNLYPGAVDVS